MSNTSTMPEIYWLNDDSREFLSKGYLREGTTPEARMRRIAEAAEAYLNKPGFADKFEKYLHNGWYSLASPIWSNFGEASGLPISCNGTFIEDTTASILEGTSEVGTMTKYGAGTSAWFGELRGRGAEISMGGTSFGAVHFMQLFDVTTKIISQSNVRRGSFAAYYPVDGPDIDEFLDIREEGHAIQEMSMGVTVPDAWLYDMVNGDKKKRDTWAKIIKKRFESGYPYILFSDSMNRNAPDVYLDKGMKIKASNLCVEIALFSDEENSFVCDLSSMNIVHYEAWKDSDAVETLAYFLDAVMEEYIIKTADIPGLRRARNFAMNQRALGIGWLGWHSYLQSKMIPFESMEAKYKNVEIARFIEERSLSASKQMAVEYGEPPLLAGYGRRNVTLTAIAPTTSSSFILGQVSPSIEPLNSNYFVKELAKGRFTFKNSYLETVLEGHGRDDKKTWDSILTKGGSVQHLEFLTDLERSVFKTFGEISQKEVVIQAAQRQKHIDQSQSLNLMIHPDTPVKEVNQLVLFAWEQGVKTLYYQRGTNPSQELARSILNCVNCEA